MLCCAGGPQLEAGSPLGASGASDGTVALWDARAREACVWRAAAHQDACTGVGIVDGGWVVSCARDGSVAASHIGGGRQRLLRAAGGGPAQRCLQAGAALAFGLLACLRTYVLMYLLPCLPASTPVALACSLTSCVLQAVGGAALTAGDGGAVYIWDVRAMQLGGALQVSQPAGQPGSPAAVGQYTLHPFTAPAQGGRVPLASQLGLGAHQFFSVPLGRWRVAFPCTRCTYTARRARRAACCSASPTARWRCGGLLAGGSAWGRPLYLCVPRPPAGPTNPRAH